jgi:LCP family protein required for cell wall assembly
MPTAIPMCNAEKAVEYFLFVAKDYEEGNDNFVSPEDYSVGFADAIRIVRVDFRDGSVSMLSIPRDLMVAVPNLESESIYQERLKIIYSYGYEYEVPGGGPSLLAQSLSSNFGFQIDHYVILNYWAFVLGIESIGGITINIPKQAGYYTPGTRHLNGWQALDYARLRDSAGEDTSDAARRERQTAVLFAIQEKVFSKEEFSKLPEVSTHLMKAIRTDLTSEEISQYLCLAENVTSVESQELNPDFYTLELDAYGKELLSPDYLAIREFVEEFQKP